MSRYRSPAEARSMMILFLVACWVIVGDQCYQAVGTGDWRAWLAAIALPPIFFIVSIGLLIAFLARDPRNGEDE